MKHAKTFIIAGVALLAVLDVVLVAFALRVGAGTAVSAQSLGHTTSASSTLGAAPSTPASGSSAPSSTAATTNRGTGRLMIVAVDADHAWRVHGGACGSGGATIERSTDGGATWKPITTSLKAITRLDTTDTDSAFVVGADQDCKPTELVTKDGGDSWAKGGDVALDWYIDPKDPTFFHNLADPGTQPCPQSASLDLAAGSPNMAWVLCKEGAVRQTYSSGREWADVGQVDAGLALTVSPDNSRVYAVRPGSSDCAGVEVVRVSSKNSVLSCTRTDASPAP